MNKIIDYKVLNARSSSDLEGLVLNNIQKGWQPAGGMSLYHSGPYQTYYQAMVKYEEPGEGNVSDDTFKKLVDDIDKISCFGEYKARWGISEAIKIIKEKYMSKL